MKNINIKNLSADQLKAAQIICSDIGLALDAQADITVTAERADSITVSGDAKNVKLTYSRDNELWRALSYVPAFIENGKEIKENAKYEMLCYMSDNSRNAVLNMDSAKQTIRSLALMGYDSMMLYTEDTYELPGYSYFGHMRGRYTEKELIELDDYAYMYGIELIPCIQTLAHLSTALRWPDFDGYKDNEDILLVGDERTYKFIEAALAQCRKCFRSKNINIGMDEAHALACGDYLRKNGYRKPSDVMIEHLEKVVPLCHKYDFEPMIWSDMFFRMAFNGAYRVATGDIPQDVADKVPEGLALVYWDYYSMNRDLFSHMLDCHNQFKNPIYFAGGAWKWYGFGAHNAFSLKSSKMQLDECEARGVNKIIVTSWGDNGGEASQYSAFASVLYFAERCYRDAVCDKCLNERAMLSLGISFDDLMAFDIPDALPGTTVDDTDSPKNPSKYMLYSDPLERLADRHVKTETAKKAWADGAERLMSLAGNEKFGYAFETLGRICRILAVKCDMGSRLYDAYSNGDKDAIKAIAENEIPVVISELETLIEVFRKQWYKENKTFGYITQEIRLGGLKERMISVKQRLDAYVNGSIDRIEELEYEALPLSVKSDGEYIRFNNWRMNVAAGIL